MPYYRSFVSLRFDIVAIAKSERQLGYFCPYWPGRKCGKGTTFDVARVAAIPPLLYSAVAGRSSAAGPGNTGGIYPLSCGRMNGEAEAWLEGAYPQLYTQWRHAYLKPAARQQDQAGDLCRICYIRQVNQLAVQ